MLQFFKIRKHRTCGRGLEMVRPWALGWCFWRRAESTLGVATASGGSMSGRSVVPPSTPWPQAPLHVKLCLPRKMRWSPEPPGPQHVTLCGDEAFAEVIKFKWGHEGGLQSSVTVCSWKWVVWTQTPRRKMTWRHRGARRLQAQEP